MYNDTPLMAGSDPRADRNRHSGNARNWIIRQKTPLAIVAINLFFFWRWFFNTGILTYGDWPYWSTASSKTFLTIPSIWSNKEVFLGSVGVLPPMYPYFLLHGLLARMGMGYPYVERISTLWPLVIVGALGSYYLVKKVVGSEIAGFVGSIVFMFNSHFSVHRTQHPSIMASFAVAPLAMLFFIKLLEEKKLHLAVGTGLLFWVVGFYDFRTLYMVSIILLFYLLYHSFVIERFRVKPFLKNCGYAAIPAAIVLLANLYWILGLFESIRGQAYFIFARANTTLGQFMNITKAIALFHPFWTGSRAVFFINQNMPAYYLAIPVVAFLGLLAGRRNKKVVFFGLISILGIIVAKQASAPFPNLFDWLFRNLPGFSVFREATRLYFLVIISYAVLIASSVSWLFSRRRGTGLLGYSRYVVTSLIVLLFLVNGVSMVTGAIGSTFVNRHKPVDYQKLDSFLNREKGYFRILWVPTVSCWGGWAGERPNVSFARAVTGYGVSQAVGTWLEWQSTLFEGEPDPSLSKTMKGFLEERYLPDLLTAASFKYVVVPIVDDKNDENFFESYCGPREQYVSALDELPYLERVDIGTGELALYRFKGFSPYVGSAETVYRIDSESGLGSVRDFVDTYLHKKFLFVLGESTGMGALSHLVNLFGDNHAIDTDYGMGRVVEEVRDATGNRANTVFGKRDRVQLTYSLDANSFTLDARSPEDLYLNGWLVPLPATAAMPLCNAAATGRDFWIDRGGALTGTKPGTDRGIGILGPGEEVVAYASRKDGSVIANGSFEEGLWTKEVADCNAYDKRPVLGMRRARRDGGWCLQLEAARHTAGTFETGIPVSPGNNYLLSFDYQSPNGDTAGYYVGFNDPNKTVLTEKIPIRDNQWHTYNKMIDVPAAASSADIFLYGYSKDEKTMVITRYDDVRLVELQALVRHTDPSGRGFSSSGLANGGGKKTFTFEDGSYSFANLIPDGSFDRELRSAEVIDCEPYDKRPVLGMRRARRDGGWCLQLEATRHTAGTSRAAVPASPGNNYLLSFDYQSPNGYNAGYGIGFNDPNKTAVTEKIPIQDNRWHSYSKVIRTPEGASSADVFLYGYSRDEKTKVITRYDNVSLIEVPDFRDWYYYVSEPSTATARPASVTSVDVNNAKKRIKVRGATDSFFLTMAEGYHAGWKLMVDNGRIRGSLSGWLPTAKPDLVSENHHYRLDGMVNAWFVNIEELTARNLIKRNPDGSYDFDLVAEFWPQRYCLAGFVVSLATVLACGCFLLVWWIRYRVRRARSRGDPTAGRAR